MITTFGANGDRPVVGDYDGDGKSDIAIFRPSDGTWWINRSTAGLVVYNFGTGTDKTVQADYTGDGKTDVAFFRPLTSEWFVLRSEDTSFYSAPFGIAGDIPVPGDYDGDGKPIWESSETARRPGTYCKAQADSVRSDLELPVTFRCQTHSSDRVRLIGLFLEFANQRLRKSAGFDIRDAVAFIERDEDVFCRGCGFGATCEF